MGRGNFLAHGELSNQWYVEYPKTNDHEDTDMFIDSVIEILQEEIPRRFNSFSPCNTWTNRDCKAILENGLFYVGIADNDNTLAVFLQSKDEDYEYTPLAQRHFKNYQDFILNFLLSWFGEISIRTSAWTSGIIRKEDNE